jgi:hypothetical protein
MGLDAGAERFDALIRHVPYADALVAAFQKVRLEFRIVQAAPARTTTVTSLKPAEGLRKLKRWSCRP